MTNRPNNIAPDNFELWTGRVELDPSQSAQDVQDIVTQYVTESGITVVGYHTESPPALTLLRWPDNREGYRAPMPPECNIALRALAARLGSKRVTTGIVSGNKIHVMMGRNKDGYHAGEVVPLQVLRDRLPDCSVTDGYMISARATNDGVEPYSEPVGIIVADPSQEPKIHELADELEQHHYAIERGWGTTDFYETRWAPTYIPNEPDA